MKTPTCLITIVAAMDGHRGIGLGNALPWHLPEDLAAFKRNTVGRPVIMGRKTHESIGRVLPGRRNVVLTRQPAWCSPGVEVASSLEVAIDHLQAEEISVIGGGQIFDEAIGRARRLLITEIEAVFACDAFFPPISREIWHEVSRVRHFSPENNFHYSFVEFRLRSDPYP